MNLHYPLAGLVERRVLRRILVLLALALPCIALADPPTWAPAHGWRKKNDPTYAGYSGRSWNDDFGIQSGRCNREDVGAVLGGIAGGTLGAEVGKEGGRAIAIVVGTVIGAAIGAGDRAAHGQDRSLLRRPLPRARAPGTERDLGEPGLWRDLPADSRRPGVGKRRLSQVPAHRNRGIRAERRAHDSLPRNRRRLAIFPPKRRCHVAEKFGLGPRPLHVGQQPQRALVTERLCDAGRHLALPVRVLVGSCRGRSPDRSCRAGPRAAAPRARRRSRRDTGGSRAPVRHRSSAPQRHSLAGASPASVQRGEQLAHDRAPARRRHAGALLRSDRAAAGRAARDRCPSQ